MSSGFFARRITPQHAPQPPQPTPAPLPFWMTGQPPGQVRPVAPVVNQPGQPVQYGGTTTPEGESHIGELLGQQDYQTTKAKSSLADNLGSCPDCGGPNYMREMGKPNTMPHCYDCGFNPRFTQSMAGVSAGQNVPVKTARQQHATSNDFSPRTIIGHA